MMGSQPASAASACGRSRPWVSEIAPMVRITPDQTTRGAACAGQAILNERMFFGNFQGLCGPYRFGEVRVAAAEGRFFATAMEFQSGMILPTSLFEAFKHPFVGPLISPIARFFVGFPAVFL